MELMDTSLDKFYKQVIDKGQTIPEDILGKIAVSVSTLRAPALSKERGGSGPPVSLFPPCGETPPGPERPSRLCVLIARVCKWMARWMLLFLGLTYTTWPGRLSAEMPLSSTFIG